MTKGQVTKLLVRLQEIKLPEGSVSVDEFAKNVYATSIGKVVIDTLIANKIKPEQLRKWGFIAAYISLSSLLN